MLFDERFLVYFKSACRKIIDDRFRVKSLPRVVEEGKGAVVPQQHLPVKPKQKRCGILALINQERVVLPLKSPTGSI